MNTFEIRVFQSTSNLMQITDIIESDDVEDAIDILYEKYAEVDGDPFFGQVWQTDSDVELLHYEINA